MLLVLTRGLLTFKISNKSQIVFVLFNYYKKQQLLPPAGTNTLAGGDSFKLYRCERTTVVSATNQFLTEDLEHNYYTLLFNQ